ncbi:MAG: DUF2809 domain-containing protein [Myxococcales bacterium]|nr:DUF2809 domain-containing protein [Myxococcales bacterium]HRC54403.1 DUF2809 domain-containing protein [Kofleriaceae bacterium]
MRRAIWLGLFALGLGLAVLLYHGPGRPLVRGHVGDVAATMLVYALLWLWPARRASAAVRAVGALAIAAAIELGQTVWTGSGLAGELVLGSTFDGWDFVAYLAGVVVALLYERGTTRAPRLTVAAA